MRLFLGTAAIVSLVTQSAFAASGALIPALDDLPGPTEVATKSELTPQEVWRRVGDELAKRRIQLAELGVRVEFRRDPAGAWFLELGSQRMGCRASREVGHFDVLSDARVRALVTEVTLLIEASHCGVPPSSSQPSQPPRPELAVWVRPAAGVYGAASILMLVALAGGSPPNASLSFRHAPSALLSSGAMLGATGSAWALFAAKTNARPLLELSVSSSISLQALAVAVSPEQGVPAYGEYAVASGYALSSLLVGIDWSLSPRTAMLEAPAGFTPQDAPRRALSPFVTYAPAVLGAAVSLSRAFDPQMSSEKRSMTLGFGAYALIPAAAGVILGVHSARRSPEKIWFTGGPAGSHGLTLHGAF